MRTKIYLDQEAKRELMGGELIGTLEVIDGKPMTRDFEFFAKHDLSVPVTLELELHSKSGAVGSARSIINAGEVKRFAISVTPDPNSIERMHLNIKARETFVV